MILPNVFRVLALLIFAGVLAYFALRTWRHRRNGEAKDSGAGFNPTIGFTRLDGWASLAVLLVNKSNSKIWAEEIEIALSELIANDQTSEPSLHEIQKINQSVSPQDMLPISLVETIYKAAGKPQRKYSCLMSAVVRFKASEDWFEETMPDHKLKMAGLTVVSDRRVRGKKRQVKPLSKLRDTQMAGTKSK